MANFMMFRGSNNTAFYVNLDHVRMIKPSKDPEASRLIMLKPDGSEEAITVQGSPTEVAQIATAGESPRKRGRITDGQ